MALHAVGSFSMCTGFGIMMVSMAFSGHIIVMVFAGAASGVVRIQTFGAIWVGKFISDAFHICSEHFEVISAVIFAYKAAMQDGAGLLMAEKMWWCCKIDHLLLGRLKTG